MDRDPQTGYLGEPKADPEFVKETLEENRFVSNVERSGTVFTFDMEEIPLEELHELTQTLYLDAGYGVERNLGYREKAHPVDPVGED